MPEAAEEKIPTTYPTKPPLDKKYYSQFNLEIMDAVYFFNHRFKPNTVKSIIQTILNEELSGKQYSPELTPQWTRLIADRIKDKIKGKLVCYENFNAHLHTMFSLELNYTRYKIVTQVFIGEQRGEGVRMATRSLWDAEADNYATHTFMSVIHKAF